MALAVAPVAFNMAKLEVAGRRVYRFSPGEATGNLTEVGLPLEGTYTRMELPETITVLADEALDVYIEYRPGHPPRLASATLWPHGRAA